MCDPGYYVIWALLFDTLIQMYFMSLYEIQWNYGTCNVIFQR